MEKMIKLNKSKIAELIAKKHLTVKMVADGAYLAYTTAKHIIQEGKDCVEATSVDKVERLAKALGTSVKAITIGKPYERYPKKAAPEKSPKKVVAKAREKLAENIAKSVPVKVADPKKLHFDNTAEKPAPAKTKKCGTATTQAAPLEIPEAKLPENKVDNTLRNFNLLLTEIAKLNERIAKVEKIVLKTSSRKKLVKVE